MPNTPTIIPSISEDTAAELCQSLYGLIGNANQLPGEIDLNFKISTDKEAYLLKISRPDADLDYIDFQSKMMSWVNTKSPTITSPHIINSLSGAEQEVFDSNAGQCQVRLLNWIEGRVWSQVNPKTDQLRASLGSIAGNLTNALRGFNHPLAARSFDWDLARADWTSNHSQLFSGKQREIILCFQERFQDIQPAYKGLRKSVIHNDANDNNIVVSKDLLKPEVLALIDYGDAVHSQTINDLAVAVAYAIMEYPDPVAAALPLIQGYHSTFPLLEDELELLYVLVGMRLVISVTKSAINKIKEPENTYLQISEKPAWNLLQKWVELDERFVHYAFRSACGLPPHPSYPHFMEWSRNQNHSITALFPSVKATELYTVDMSVESNFLGNEQEYTDHDLSTFKIAQLQKKHPNTVIGGGYLEYRPFYNTSAYQRLGNSGDEWRTCHLGTDYWLPAQTPVHAVIDGVVHSLHDNGQNRDYGPTLILKHKVSENLCFYSLYGHLSMTSLDLFKKGDNVKAGDLIGYIGDVHENGSWVPHLHIQLLFDLLGNEVNFPGVAFPAEEEIWRSLCPDVGSLFKECFQKKNNTTPTELIAYRQQHLGKSLSLSYDQPLNVVRGQDAFLMDEKGQKFLDTVNNVAHVGHEHSSVVSAGQDQMGMLNTNTRYLHPAINEFANELLSTFPDELSVVHFVNSGSEANELALRMASTYSGQKDFIALEIGYHGNTNAVIDVSSYKFDSKGGKGKPPYTHIVPLPDQYRGIHADEPHKYAKYVSQEIEKVKSEGRNIAGFICESIVSCGGQIVLPDGYLKIAYESTRAAGGVCIADEVQVGCGRVGEHFWGFELQGVIPDIVTIGKPIGNGHPLGAVVCTRQVADAFANGMEYFNTFGGNPVSCRIGTEVLRVVKREKLQQHALTIGNFLKSELRALQAQSPIIGDVRGHGLFLGIEITTADKKPLPQHTSYLVERMKNMGILMSSDGPDHNVLKIKPPMVFSKENARTLVTRLAGVLDEDYMKAY